MQPRKCRLNSPPPPPPNINVAGSATITNLLAKNDILNPIGNLTFHSETLSLPFFRSIWACFRLQCSCAESETSKLIAEEFRKYNVLLENPGFVSISLRRKHKFLCRIYLARSVTIFFLEPVIWTSCLSLSREHSVKHLVMATALILLVSMTLLVMLFMLAVTLGRQKINSLLLCLKQAVSHFCLYGLLAIEVRKMIKVLYPCSLQICCQLHLSARSTLRTSPYFHTASHWDANQHVQSRPDKRQWENTKARYFYFFLQNWKRDKRKAEPDENKFRSDPKFSLFFFMMQNIDWFGKTVSDWNLLFWASWKLSQRKKTGMRKWKLKL